MRKARSGQSSRDKRHTGPRTEAAKRKADRTSEHSSSDRRTGPASKPQNRSRPAPTTARPQEKPRSRGKQAPSGPAEPMRIAKAMAHAGLCSRRDAERWIAEGRVTVNGKTLTSPALEVGPKDRINVDGQPLPAAEPLRLWRYAKPKGMVTTHRDPQKRPTVFDNLPPELPRVVSVGRLDFNTEGLLLLTNNGDLARHLELPSTGWLRRYRVRAHGRVAQAQLDALGDGVTIDDVHYGPVEATLDSTQGANVWLTIGLREGKNREVRKILSSLDLEVNRLIRVSFGPFQLLDLKPGSVEIVRRRVLAAQLGPKLAETFGLAGEADTEAGNAPSKSRPAPRDSQRKTTDKKPISKTSRAKNTPRARKTRPGAQRPKATS